MRPKQPLTREVGMLAIKILATLTIHIERAAAEEVYFTSQKNPFSIARSGEIRSRIFVHVVRMFHVARRAVTADGRLDGDMKCVPTPHERLSIGSLLCERVSYAANIRLFDQQARIRCTDALTQRQSEPN